MLTNCATVRFEEIRRHSVATTTAATAAFYCFYRCSTAAAFIASSVDVVAAIIKMAPACTVLLSTTLSTASTSKSHQFVLRKVHNVGCTSLLRQMNRVARSTKNTDVVIKSTQTKMLSVLHTGAWARECRGEHWEIAARFISVPTVGVLSCSSSRRRRSSTSTKH
jgi:hypothetical protein